MCVSQGEIVSIRFCFGHYRPFADAVNREPAAVRGRVKKCKVGDANPRVELDHCRHDSVIFER